VVDARPPRCFAFGLLTIVTGPVATLAFSQPSVAPEPKSGPPIVAFDIPAQPLAGALGAFGSAASVQLFYETALMAGRTSTAVRGTFSPAAGLQILLTGTGLAATSFDPGTVTIVLAPKQSAALDLAAAKARAVPFAPYFALIQARLRSAICQAPVTQTDPSEIRVQLWIAPSGSVAQAKLLSSTGSEVRDHVYLDTLRALAIAAPPPSMPQPVTLMILPRNSPESAECLPVNSSPSIRCSQE
jgi:Secretin and TonB N terminus short domain